MPRASELRRLVPRLLAACLGASATATAQIVFEPPVVAASVLHSTQGVIAADVDLDGHLDLITVPTFNTVFEPSKFSVLLGHGDGSFDAPILKEIGGNDAGLGDAAFLNADALPDLVFVMHFTSPFFNSFLDLFFGAGDGTFPTHKLVGASSTKNYVDVVPMDLTGDGLLDLVALDASLTIFTNGSIVTFLADGTGEYTNIGGPAVSSAASRLAIGDVNGDSLPDAVVAHLSGTLSVALGVMGGGFGAAATQIVAGHCDGMLLRDLDGDGQLDVVVSNAFLGRVVTLLGDGQGHFSTQQALPVPGAPRNLSTGDLDDDGHLDLLVSRDAGDVAVLRGAGDGTFGFVTAVSHVDVPRGSAVADLDEDGAPDAAVGQSGGSFTGKVSVMRNATYAAGSPFTDLGHSKPGTNGYPILLAGGSLQISEPVSFALANALPLVNTSLVLGFSELDAPFKGGVLVPSADVVFAPLQADATGATTLAAPWPPGVPSGFTFYVQSLFPDAGAVQNVASSSGVRVVAP